MISFLLQQEHEFEILRHGPSNITYHELSRETYRKPTWKKEACYSLRLWSFQLSCENQKIPPRKRFSRRELTSPVTEMNPRSQSVQDWHGSFTMTLSTWSKNGCLNSAIVSEAQAAVRRRSRRSHMSFLWGHFQELVHITSVYIPLPLLSQHNLSQWHGMSEITSLFRAVQPRLDAVLFRKRTDAGGPPQVSATMCKSPVDPLSWAVRPIWCRIRRSPWPGEKHFLVLSLRPSSSCWWIF